MRKEERKNQRIPFRRVARRSLFVVRPRSLSFPLRLCVCGEGESDGPAKGCGRLRDAQSRCRRLLPRSERLRPLCACLCCCALSFPRTDVPMRVKAQSWTRLLSGLQTVNMPCPCRAIISCSVARMCTRTRCEMPCRAVLAVEVWLTWRGLECVNRT